MAIAEDYNFETLNIISGNLEVRLAENNLEIDAAQSLRYKVFFVVAILQLASKKIKKAAAKPKKKPTANKKKTEAKD